MLKAVPERIYTQVELDAALAAIAAPGRLREAQDVVMRTAPALQRLLASALAEGGWFDAGHTQAVRQAVAIEDPGDREREVHTLVAEETRLGMLVGVAVGFQLARELEGEGQQPGRRQDQQERAGAGPAQQQRASSAGQDQQGRGTPGARQDQQGRGMPGPRRDQQQRGAPGAPDLDQHIDKED